jgi:hypothetical protein
MTDADQRDWNAIRAAVVTGMSTRAAAERFGVPYATLARRCAAEGWTKDREQVDSAARAETDAQIRDRLVARGLAAAENADVLAEALEQAGVKKVAEFALSMEPQSWDDVEMLARLTHTAANTLTRTHGVRRLALGLDAADGAKSAGADLDIVLRQLEASGDITPPRAEVSEGSQREPGTSESF